MAKRRFNHATVVAYLALFVALGGTGYAVATIDGDDVRNGSLTSADIRDDSLKSPDIAQDAVRAPDIASNAVKGGEVARDALTGQDIAEARLGTVPDARTVDGTEVDASPLVRLSEGQERPLLRQPPFTFSGVCRRDGGQVRTTVFVASSEPGEFHSGTFSPFGGADYTQGDRKQIALNSISGRWTTQAFSAVTASGRRAFGVVGAGLDVFGSQCTLSILSLGGDGAG